MTSAAALRMPVHGAAETHASDALRVTVLIGVFTLLFFEPLAFGGVEPWSIFAFETACVLLFGLWAIAQKVSGELYLAWNPVFVPALLFASLVLIQVLFRHTAYAQLRSPLFCFFVLTDCSLSYWFKACAKTGNCV